MAKLYRALHRLWNGDGGQDLIEYAFLSAAIALSVAFAFPSIIAAPLSTIFFKVVSCLRGA